MVSPCIYRRLGSLCMDGAGVPENAGVQLFVGDSRGSWCTKYKYGAGWSPIHSMVLVLVVCCAGLFILLGGGTHDGVSPQPTPSIQRVPTPCGGPYVSSVSIWWYAMVSLCLVWSGQ